MFKHLKVGDSAIRSFCGIIRTWRVTEVEGRLVTIGLGWTFCRNCGYEVDKDLNWSCVRTGSRLIKES